MFYAQVVINECVGLVQILNACADVHFANLVFLEFFGLEKINLQKGHVNNKQTHSHKQTNKQTMFNNS